MHPLALRCTWTKTARKQVCCQTPIRVALNCLALRCGAQHVLAMRCHWCFHRKAHVAMRFPLQTLIGVVNHSAPFATDTAPTPLLLVQTSSPESVQR